MLHEFLLTLKSNSTFSCTQTVLSSYFLRRPQNFAIAPSYFWRYLKMVFCHQNCSDLLWEKIVLVIEKNFWNSRLKAKNFQKFWDHFNNLFKQWKVRTISGNRTLFKLVQISKNRTIIIQIGKNYWDLEICRKS